MAIKMGKLMTQVLCPLCNTVWFLENNEWFYDNPKDKNSLAAHFYCYECEREVKFDFSKTIPVISNFPLGPVLYTDDLFYEDEEIEEFYKKQEEDELMRMNRLFCRLTGGHRFQGAPDTFIDKHEMVHYRHTCTKCGKMCEWTVPWRNVVMYSTRIDELEEKKR